MKISEMVTMLRAGYSKAEIDAIRLEESQTEETSAETTEETLVDTSGETVKETSEGADSKESDSTDLLKASIEELQKTILEMQKSNLQNARMPEVEEKSPLDVASDIIFETMNV